MADDDAERIAGAIAAFNSPPRMIQPPGPPPSPSAATPATGARCLACRTHPPAAGKMGSRPHAAAHLKAALVDKDALEWPLANCAPTAAGAARTTPTTTLR